MDMFFEDIEASLNLLQGGLDALQFLGGAEPDGAATEFTRRKGLDYVQRTMQMILWEAEDFCAPYIKQLG